MLTLFNIEKLQGLYNKVMQLLCVKSFQLLSDDCIYNIVCL